MTSVHSKTTSQRHCISNVRHDPGYGLDGFANAGGHKHSAGLNIQCGFNRTADEQNGSSLKFQSFAGFFHTPEVVPQRVNDDQ
jgi:hypothetical protein